jgi:hypothetical protein
MNIQGLLRLSDEQEKIFWWVAHQRLDANGKFEKAVWLDASDEPSGS